MHYAIANSTESCDRSFAPPATPKALSVVFSASVKPAGARDIHDLLGSTVMMPILH